MFALRTPKDALWYCSNRIRNLAAQVATRYEDEGKPEIANELIEVSIVLRLIMMILERGETVRIQGDDYVGDGEDRDENDVPF